MGPPSCVQLGDGNHLTNRIRTSRICDAYSATPARTPYRISHKSEQRFARRQSAARSGSFPGARETFGARLASTRNAIASNRLPTVNAWPMLPGRPHGGPDRPTSSLFYRPPFSRPLWVRVPIAGHLATIAAILRLRMNQLRSTVNAAMAHAFHPPVGLPSTSQPLAPSPRSARDFASWHSTQSNCLFSSSSEPPCDSGTTWSTWAPRRPQS